MPIRIPPRPKPEPKPTSSWGDPRRRQPLEVEFRSGRIAADLNVVADRFEIQHRTATSLAGGIPFLENRPPDQPVGPEITGSAALECRFLGYKLGLRLYDAMVRLCVEDAPLWELAGESYPGQSTDRRELMTRGRERAVTVLRLTETAQWEFDAFVAGRMPRWMFGLGTAAPRETRLVAAANDNAKKIGNAVFRTSGLRQWRESETAIAADLNIGTAPAQPVVRAASGGRLRVDANWRHEIDASEVAMRAANGDSAVDKFFAANDNGTALAETA